MAVTKTEKSSSSKPPQKRRDRAAEIANTFEWLITAFILAFVFRAFVMEAFRIPTGSMADTLKGAHFRLRCRQCGYRYEYGFQPQKYDPRFPEDYVPLPGNLRSFPSRCPSCGYYQATGGAMPVANGDRILVLKCLYQFFEPKRWDVIVFKNPLDPRVNFIKRLVGLPGEKLEIIDGDVYIGGKISRKPPKVQNELWMPVYNNDYRPARPAERSFNKYRLTKPTELVFNRHNAWQQPFDVTNSRWQIDNDSWTKFVLDSPVGKSEWLAYNSSVGNNFKATYAYDDIERYGGMPGYNDMPYCSDLMVRFYANPSDSQGFVGIELSKYETRYRAWVDLTGKMFITKNEKNGKITELAKESIEPPTINKPALVKFVNVDHQLIFKFGSEKLTCELGLSPEAAGPRKTRIEPQVKIFGSGRLTLSHVAIFRDIHYTAKNVGSGEPFEFKLEEDEFFVLGDNSPNSQDSRMWARKGRGIDGQLLYREGTVPRDYLVGKALFIYWPSGFKFPWPESLRTFLFRNSRHSRLCRVMYWIVSLNWIPSIEQSFIYGGSNKSE